VVAPTSIPSPRGKQVKGIRRITITPPPINTESW
jgi:hypothetical protein